MKPTLSEAIAFSKTLRPKPSPVLARWQKRAALYRSGVPVPKSIINAAKSALHRVECIGSSGYRLVRGSKLGGDEYDALIQLLAPSESAIPEPLGWAITPEQTEQGFAWLRKLPKRYRPNLEGFDRFSFDGLYLLPDTGTGDYSITAWAPVYRVHLKDGSSWAYYALPWQARRSDGCPYEVVP